MNNKGTLSVDGEQVSQHIIDAALNAMKTLAMWRASDIERVIAGTPGSAKLNTPRVADRLIQRERKADRIEAIDPRPYWRWK